MTSCSEHIQEHETIIYVFEHEAMPKGFDNDLPDITYDLDFRVGSLIVVSQTVFLDLNDLSNRIQAIFVCRYRSRRCITVAGSFRLKVRNVVIDMLNDKLSEIFPKKQFPRLDFHSETRWIFSMFN